MVESERIGSRLVTEVRLNTATQADDRTGGRTGQTGQTGRMRKKHHRKSLPTSSSLEKNSIDYRSVRFF
jgi:hypothetical protein